MQTGVAYIRVSKARDDMITQSTQLEKIKQYCDLHNIELVAEYVDLDYSGRSTNRPKFQEMFKDIINNKLNIDYLLVYKLDRLARSVSDFHTFIDILDKNSIDFISITQNFNTSIPVGRLMRNVLVDFAQFESEMTASRVKDNMIHNAKNGVWNGGPIPFGFTQTEDDKQANLRPNQEAKHVIQFYKWYTAPGGSIRNCVFKANKLGILTSKGKEWNPNQIGRILKNPIYCIADDESIAYFEEQGHTIYNKKAADGKRGFIRYNHRKVVGTSSKIRNKSEWLISVAQHDGIVNSDLYIKTQTKRQKRAGGRIKKRETKGLLAWLIKCGKCNKSLSYTYGISNSKTNSRIYYYRCSTKMKQGTEVCEGQTVRSEELEKAILDKLFELSSNQELLNQLTKDSESEFIESIKLLERREKKLQEKLNKISQKEDNLVDKIKLDISDKLLKLIETKVDKLNEKKTKTQEKLKTIQEDLAEYKNNLFNKDLMIKQLRKFENKFDQMKLEEKRSFLQTIIDKIVFNKGKIRIELFPIDTMESLTDQSLQFDFIRTRVHSRY
ncbi:recombinase family protein [Natroniella acetigena]|uniref:recombinase family protein n=1 Tax=Natroniella acetigena TaxID=52004 RepID=UPI00200B26B2|nr:recombinase family protein [Natroniella acetigena]MCK8827124.1 recombinase family protein [Natroniella acetigena]